MPPKFAFSLRAVIYGALVFVAWTLAVASAPTPLVTMENTSSFGPFYATSESTFGMWTSCNKVDSNVPTAVQPETCDDTLKDDPVTGKGPPDCAKSMVNAVRAFTIIAILCFTAGFALPALDLFMASALPPMTLKLVMAGAGGAMFVTSLISWSIQLSIWSNECVLGSTPPAPKTLSDVPGAKLGASPFLMLAAWLFTIGLMVVAMVVPGAPADSATNDVTQMMSQPLTSNGAMTQAKANAAAGSQQQQKYEDHDML